MKGLVKELGFYYVGQCFFFLTQLTVEIHLFHDPECACVRKSRKSFMRQYFYYV